MKPVATFSLRERYVSPSVGCYIPYILCYIIRTWKIWVIVISTIPENSMFDPSDRLSEEKSLFRFHPGGGKYTSKVFFA